MIPDGLKDHSAFVCRVKESKQTAWSLKMKALWYFRTSAAQRYISEGLCTCKIKILSLDRKLDLYYRIAQYKFGCR